MSDNALMTEIMGKIMKVADPQCLETIENAAFSRKRDLRQKDAAIETASWMIGDEVKTALKHRNRKPYGAVGKIVKINNVTINVDFGNHGMYSVPKTMLVKS